jgi:hypothetical protein
MQGGLRKDELTLKIKILTMISIMKEDRLEIKIHKNLNSILNNQFQF